MTTKHTPGPWEIPHTDKEIKQALICSGGIPIKANEEKFGEKCALFLLPVNAIFGNECTAIANARLIAAAPELLEAALAALPFLEAQGYTGGDIVDGLKAAIAKAEGK